MKPYGTSGAKSAIALDIIIRRPYAGGMVFGSVGPYERIEGSIRVDIDPHDPHNAGIVDIEHAARNEDSRVACRAGVRILRPVRQERGNRRLLFDVVNRGNPTALTSFNQAPDRLGPGDGFLMRHGYTVASCGWQGDLLGKRERVDHGFPPAPGLLRAHLPEALTADGNPIAGPISITFQPDRRVVVQPLAAGAQRPHPVRDVNDPGAVLYVREHANAPKRQLPRDAWSFARLENDRVAPDPSFVHCPEGFEPGRIYTLVYTTQGAVILGLGMAVVRDFVSFLRYARSEAGNPCAGAFDRVLAFGRSQSGSFLRQMIYRGLTRDVNDRPVFDGILCLVAGGGRTEVNQRFGQPGAGPKHTLGRTFPFAGGIQTDPVTGVTDGLLRTPGARAPKIFFINTSSEYWRGDAALIHIAPDGSHDLAESESVRIYHYAGTQHSPGRLPHDGDTASGRSDRPLNNAIDYRPLLRAALVRLDRWVSGMQPPPPSRHPRLDEATAVTPEHVASVFRGIPRTIFPSYLPGMHRMDFGPRASEGILTRLPPEIGQAYPALVPAVDADGNEVAGIRPPEVAVPVATHTGWRSRDPRIGGAEQLHTLVGATIPLPATSRARQERSDPRLSIEERYASRREYRERVMQAVHALLQEGHLLDEDVQEVVDRAVTLYNILSNPVSGDQNDAENDDDTLCVPRCSARKPVA